MNRSVMTPQQCAAVIAEALTWNDTPYHPHARLKGVGVDCAMLLAEVYERAGIIPHVDPGYYPPQFGMHRDEEVFERFVLEHGVRVRRPLPGGVVLFKYGRCFSHAGIMISDHEFMHAALNVGRVCHGSLNDGEVLHRERRFYGVRG